MKTTNLRTKLFSVAVTLFALMAAENTAFAQQQEASDENSMSPKFGIKGGVNFANLYVDNVKDEHLKIGGNVGFFAKLPVAKGVSIQPELLYSSKGAKETYSNFAQGSGEYRFNLNYLEVPLMLVFNLTENFSLSAGGYAAYLMSANVKDVDDNGNINGTTDLSAEDFHRFDYGLVGGASVDIDRFTIGARYNYGLQNIGKSGSLSGDLTQNSKNSVASLFVGFAF